MLNVRNILSEHWNTIAGIRKVSRKADNDTFAHLHEIGSQYMMKKNQERIGGADDKEIQDQAHGR